MKVDKDLVARVQSARGKVDAALQKAVRPGPSPAQVVCTAAFLSWRAYTTCKGRSRWSRCEAFNTSIRCNTS